MSCSRTEYSRAAIPSPALLMQRGRQLGTWRCRRKRCRFPRKLEWPQQKRQGECRDREVLLRRLSGESFAGIAAAMGISRERVRQV